MVIGSVRDNFIDICNLDTFIKRASVVDKYEVEIYKHLSLYSFIEHTVSLKEGKDKKVV
jgi:hypothetical protein